MLTISICQSCLTKPQGGGTDDDALATLRDGLTAAIQDMPVNLRLTDCMNVCAEPATLALQAPGRATYIFAGVQVADDSADIIATCRLYLDSPDGWIVDARPCGRLRQKLRARVPAP